MPTVHNPSAFNLRCEPADKEIRAGDKIEVTHEVAARVSRCVFIVDGGELEIDETDEAKAPATRKTTTRGAKQAELTEAPEVETR